MSAFVVESIALYERAYPYVDGLILQVTQRIDRIALEHLARARGRSNYTLRWLVRLWLNLFVNLSIMPLHISMVVGAAMCLLGFVGVTEVAIEALLGDPPPGWASLLLLSGTQFVMLGLLGEYLGRLFLTANRKPQFLIREVVPPAAEQCPPVAGALP